MNEPLAITTGLKAGDVLGEARNGDDMLAIWRTAREKIGLSNAHCDELANFTDGQTDKLLGPSGTKGFGPLTFNGLNWTMAIKWVAVVDAEQLAIVGQYWKDRQRQINHVRQEPGRVSKQIIARARPILLKEFGEKLAVALGLAFGDDIGQLLGDQPASASEAQDPDLAQIAASAAPSPAPKTPAKSRSHLRVVATHGSHSHLRIVTKRGSRFG